MFTRAAICFLLLASLPLCAQQSSQPAQQSAKPAAQTPQEANPFPEEQSRKAAEDPGSAPSDSKQPANYSSSHVNLHKFDEDADRDSRISDGAGNYIHNPELAAKDDKVGKFYMQSGDYQGAYNRYKEATLVAPEDGDAVFGLAEAARGLHKDKEAAENYKLYLDAFPDGKKSKDAHKALAQLNAAPGKAAK